jgi:5-methylcytosine-specific restriction protein B
MEMIMLDERIKKDLTERYQAMQDRGELLSKAQLDAYYATFRRRFGPEVLANLDGEALLSTMHDHGNRDSLVYWLEFKSDDEFPGTLFGSISGGSALKLGIYKRNETGMWMTGSPQKQVELTVQGAIEIARRHRDQFLAGADVLSQLPRQADDGTYARLQADLLQVAPNVADTSWGHKYFSLLFPDRLDQLHNASYQRYHLVKLLQEPPATDGRYSCAGRFARAADELGISIYHLMRLLYERNREPHYYWRVGTSDGKHPRKWWSEMRDGSFVAVGWPDIGDLSSILYNQSGKDVVRQRMATSYPSTPQAVGRSTQQLFYFTALVKEGDVVLASDGAATLGIGRVTGQYQFVTGSEFPHRRSVEWLSLEEWRPPKPEGLQTTLHQIRDFPNLIEIEQRLLEPVLPPPVVGSVPPILPPPPLPPRPLVPELNGIPGRVQAVLDRKRQVILYGPPGTGKTYWARLAALDLAALAVFGTPFDQLPAEQQKVVVGDDADQTGLVRLCAFHPAYGYEDFLEGYRPLQTNGQLAFERRDGIFKRLCDDARRDPNRRYFLIVDEINRGDIPRIFGELLTVLERDKRGRPIWLPLSGQPFSVPDNVYLIGTMNTADRSIALLDTALRRRFGFVELMPDSRVLGKAVINGIPLGPWLDALNRRICEHVGRDARNLQVGHAYLLDSDRPVADFARFARIIQDDVIPLLEEYCYEDYDALEKILGSTLVDRTNQRIRYELFDPSRHEELIAALLAPAPHIATSLSATTVEAAAPSEEPGEGDENGDDEAAAA